ncbi:MAG: glycosyl hydrolase [Planctomycetota bacterium]
MNAPGYFASLMLALVLIGSPAGASPLSDPEATPETVLLYNNLKRAAKQHLLYGQYSPFTRGKHVVEDRPSVDVSDCHTLVGAHPAVVEFGLHKTENYAFWRRAIPELHKRGILISLSSHSRNPDLTIPYNHSHMDNRGDPVRKVLDRTSSDHRAYIELLNGYGNFIRSLRDEAGRPIPVFLRMYHEHSGHWFWWGSKTCTPEEFNALWRMTADHFRNTMGLHNLILVISPSKPETTDKFLERFPGQDYVDVYGFDSYASERLPELLLSCSRVVADLARKDQKVAAITEFGVKGGLSATTDPRFYSRMFLDELKSDPLASEVAYALTWFGREPRVDDTTGNWSAYPDEPSTRHVYRDFVDFRADPWTVFEGDYRNLYKEWRD